MSEGSLGSDGSAASTGAQSGRGHAMDYGVEVPAARSAEEADQHALGQLRELPGRMQAVLA